MNTTDKMKRYIGTKQVMAEPMDESTALQKGYARQNTDSHEWRPGYHVQYTNPDGSTYDSWSPTSVFNKSYCLAETPLDRMHIERDQLCSYIALLEEAIHSGVMTGEERLFAMIQLCAMQQYNYSLAFRITNLKKQQIKEEENEKI